ncbi:SseB family protein [Actinoplanes oblitus]|uniref:SseB family protein n=1 Tax=Actinoplanes oblitus TaxID=3040509 RepID=A0ABY8WJF5_9ACTN|nr:SseB family protein [Actinoplanes oblitus]WIM97999.1 SseB family protein [Actinoplanes oblitus]
MSEDWTPANDVENALVAALVADDRQSFFQLLSVADLFLPQLTRDPSAAQRFLTVHAFEHVLLPVFTSVRALAAQFGHAIDGYTVTNYAELRRKWPHPEWRLAIDPGTPLAVFLPVEDLAEAAVGDLRVPSLAEVAAEAAEDLGAEDDMWARHQAAGDYPQDDAAAMRLAARAGDVYGYLDRLLDSTVLIPTTRPAEPEEIAEPGFPWAPAPDRMIEVFTSAESLAASHPEPTVVTEVPFALALAVWPEDHGVAVDPDGDSGFRVAADDVPVLLAFEPEPPVRD